MPRRRRRAPCPSTPPPRTSGPRREARKGREVGQAEEEQAEFEPYDDPADDLEAEAEAESEAAELDDRSEIERTVAFQPLEPAASAEDEAGAEHNEAEPAGPPAAKGSTDDDDTAVIPPASQAANRRLNK